jgi:hypothetical protein
VRCISAPPEPDIIQKASYTRILYQKSGHYFPHPAIPLIHYILRHQIAIHHGIVSHTHDAQSGIVATRHTTKPVSSTAETDAFSLPWVRVEWHGAYGAVGEAVEAFETAV